MPRVIPALLFLAAISSHAPAQITSSPAPPPSLRAAFWNIQWFPGRSPNASPGAERAQIAAVQNDLRAQNFDLLGMEEVRDFEHAAIAVASLPGFKVDACSNFPPREGQDVGQQVALASRLPSLGAWVEQWKTSGALTPPRGFAFAAYQLAPRKLLLVYTVHLKSNRGEIAEDIAIRSESMRQLIEHMAAMRRAYAPLGELSWLVGGDFNTAPDDARFASEGTTRSLLDTGFRWGWENIPFAARITLPPDKLFPAACFDHVFYRGLTLQKASVIPTSRSSSDHRAIYAEFAN